MFSFLWSLTFRVHCWTQTQPPLLILHLLSSLLLLHIFLMLYCVQNLHVLKWFISKWKATTLERLLFCKHFEHVSFLSVYHLKNLYFPFLLTWDLWHKLAIFFSHLWWLKTSISSSFFIFHIWFWFLRIFIVKKMLIWIITPKCIMPSIHLTIHKNA